VCAAARRATAIANMIDAMEAGGADGINVDFEGVRAATRNDFTAFIRELRAALTMRGHPEAGIGIAGPAVDWTEAFDLGALAPLIDVYFIMGYGYHWNGSNTAGPNGQLRVAAEWRPHISISMERTLDHYTSLVPAELRSKIVLGVPYYGIDWPAQSDVRFAPATANGSSRTYAVSRRALASGTARRYDEEAENPWYAYQQNGAWRQTWYDDEESLAAKYQLALEQGIGGVGMWALGYDEMYPELWDTLDAYFTAEPIALDGTREAPIAIEQFPFSDANDTRTAPSNWFNRYACAPDLAEYGRERVYTLSVCQSGRLEVRVTDGASVDVDLHLLSAPREDACIARADAAIAQSIAPGEYWIVADTFVSSYVPQAGAYALSVDFVPDDASGGCRTSEICRAGRCETTGPAVILPEAMDVSTTVQLFANERSSNSGDMHDQPVVTAEMHPQESGCNCSSGQVRMPAMTLADILLVLSCLLLIGGLRLTSNGPSSSNPSHS
jgi:hypothetical protein